MQWPITDHHSGRLADAGLKDFCWCLLCSHIYIAAKDFKLRCIDTSESSKTMSFRLSSEHFCNSIKCVAWHFPTLDGGAPLSWHESILTFTHFNTPAHLFHVTGRSSRHSSSFGHRHTSHTATNSVPGVLSSTWLFFIPHTKSRPFLPFHVVLPSRSLTNRKILWPIDTYTLARRLSPLISYDCLIF